MTDARRIKGQQTQAKLIAALLELAADGGLQAVSAGKLAKRSGVSTGTIFHHFGSIEALSLQAMQRWFDQTMQGLDAPAEGGEQKLDAYLYTLGEVAFAMVQDQTRFRATMAFLHRGIYDEQYRSALAPMMQGYAEQQLKRLAELCNRPSSDPQVKAWSQAISASLDGLCTQLAITQDLAACRLAFNTLARAAAADLNPKPARKDND